jgi:integrase
MKLNQRNVDALARPEGKTERYVWDDEIRGLGVRLWRSGGSWIVFYRINRRQRKRKIGDLAKITAEEARAEAKRILAKVQLGQDPQAERQAERLNTRTFLAAANAYLDAKQLQVERGQYRANSLYVTRLYLTNRRYFGNLHGVPLTDVSVADLALRINSINKDSGTPSASRARAAARAFFTWCMQEGLLGTSPYNPVVGTKAPPNAAPRDLVLSDHELVEVWRAAGDGDFAKVVRLLILTACRRSEIGGLRWSEIDLDAGTLTISPERSKNHRAHTLPITPLAAEILKSVPKMAGRALLFGQRSSDGYAGWVMALAALRARLKGKLSDKSESWTPHDIRRSVVTWLAEHGEVNPWVIEQILGHQSGHKAGVAGTYNRAQYFRQVRSALGIWDSHLAALLEGSSRKIIAYPQGR